MIIKKYWNKVDVGGLINFPVLEFEMNGHGLISYYNSINEIIGDWSHYIVEPVGKNDFPNYFIDSKFQLIEIVFNSELRFKEPILKGNLTLEKYIELIDNAEIKNLNLKKPTLDLLDKLEKAMEPS